jgi:hypothetical protein
MTLKKSTIKIFSILFMLNLISTTISCSKEEKNNTNSIVPTVPTVELGGSLGTRTLYKDTIYVLDRFAYVDNGNVLTIQAGTIIKAKTGDGANSSALIIARGGRLNAVGTASEPIIFTSIQDEIKPGQTSSTLNVDSKGLWAGIIILGRAPISALNGDTIGSIEGIPSTYSFGSYGGSNAADNSGTLSYISIRFTGTELLPDEEIQGLTLGGVGSGTTINNIEIISSDDDGVELFGGTVNVSNILVAYQSDDAIDLDQNYNGTISNALVFTNNASAGNDGLEFDGPENSTYTTGKFILENSTIVNLSGAGRAGTLKSGAQGEIRNCAFKDFTSWIRVDGSSAVNKYKASNLKITNSEFNVSTTIADAIVASVDQDSVRTLFGAAGNTKVSTFTKGANTSVFNWTWAKSLTLF